MTKRQVIAAIVERDGRILFGKRSLHRAAAPGYWCTVCGHIEPGESEPDAVRREVLEEVGLEVKVIRKVGECDTHDGTAVIHWWLTAPVDATPARLRGDEHTELRWVTREEMYELQPAFSEDLAIIARAFEAYASSSSGEARASAASYGNGDVASAYDAWADTYDTDANRTRELAASALRQSPLRLDAARVVELGCGTGRNTEWIARRAASVVALDLSEGMLARAAQRTASLPARLLKHDITEAWPLPPSSGDVVIAMLVLEHVRDLSRVFAEVRRALAPGGELWLIELHPTRQMLGKGARFTDPTTGQLTLVTAFPHDVSDYLNEGVRAGLSIIAAGEPRDEGAGFADPPRLLWVHFRAPCAPP